MGLKMLTTLFFYLAVGCLPTWVQGPLDGYMKGVRHLDIALSLSGTSAPVAAGALGQRAVVIPARTIFQYESHFGFFINLTGGYNWRLDEITARDQSAILRIRPDYQVRKPRN